MKSILIVLVLTLACGVALADTGFVIDPIPVLDTDCVGPAVASSDDGLTMVAFTGIGTVTMSFVITQLLPTHPQTDVPWPDPVLINAGSYAKLCWSRDGFTLAFLSGGVILLYQSDLAGNWDLENYTMMDPGGEVMSLDLWGAPSDAAGPAVFLTWQATPTPSEPGGNVYFASRSYLGWSERELVSASNGIYPFPQITWSLGPAGPWPTIFYLAMDGNGTQLLNTTKNLETGNWGTPVEVPGDGVSTPTPLEGEFDVAKSFALTGQVLGLGPQPTCPCGTLHYQFMTPDAGWHPAQEISVDYDELDWPKSPCIDTESGGKVHAFWYQLASGPGLEPHLKTLEYWTGNWGDLTRAGDYLDSQSGGPLGSLVALDVSPSDWPVLAWTRRDTIEGAAQPEQVWIARPQDPSGVGETPVPLRQVSLEAWPNPFNPLVNMEFVLPETGQIRLEIFDPRGRRVTCLVNGLRSAGSQTASWSGKDDHGQNQPSGVYFARLVTAQGSTVRKLVLAR